MARPRNAIPTVTMSIRLPKPTLEAIEERANAEGITRNALTARMLTNLMRSAMPLPVSLTVREER